MSVKAIWYERLIKDLKEIDFSIIENKYFFGKKILEEQKKRKYGDETIKRISKDLKIEEREIYRRIQFAKKCHSVTELKDKSWRWICHNYLPALPRKSQKIEFDIKNIQNYDSNFFYFVKHYEYSFEGLCMDLTHSKKRIFKYSYPTLTTQTTFIHPNGWEFNLREYAKVQDFSENYKFVGSPIEIKKQIGNAVSPKMSEYIIKKYIKGNSYIELFAGCGGFSLGAKNLNKKCLWANDFDKYAGYSFKLNFPETLISIEDIKK